MKKDYGEDTESNEHELKTEVIERTATYWTGRIHRADGSIVNVEVSNLENLMKQYEAQKQR